MDRITIPEPEVQTRGAKPSAGAAAWAGLNLGCGERFHAAWTNLDLMPADPAIRQFDVTQPLPFEDGVFDAVYHSHLLEHLPRHRALPFLRECRRVLRPGGILRLAIPNLEAIARLYLYALDDAWRGDAEALSQHRWLVMELYDRATRETSGGATVAHMQTETCPLAWYRLGADGEIIRQHKSPAVLHPTWRDRVREWVSGSWRERLVRWLLGKDYALLEVGRFRRGGEVHQWMYDRVSLRELLRGAGFVNFRCVGPAESGIPNWIDYHLDITPDGAVRRPDFLFVEAER